MFNALLEQMQSISSFAEITRDGDQVANARLVTSEILLGHEFSDHGNVDKKGVRSNSVAAEENNVQCL